jgi:hypothetical protein
MDRTLVPLHRVAYTRSGDKGDISNIGVIAFTPDLYRLLKDRIDAALVRAHFKSVVKGEIAIYPMDNIDSLQVVMRGALGGGATQTLRFDQTGKSMAVLMQQLPVPFSSNELALIPERPPMAKKAKT